MFWGGESSLYERGSRFPTRFDKRELFAELVNTDIREIDVSSKKDDRERPERIERVR